MIQCQKCGFENPEESKFCGNCAAPLVGETPTSVAGSIPPPPQGTPLPGYEHQDSPSKPKSSVWIWVIGGLFLFCSCGGVIMAAILFPVFAQAKLAAQKTRALSHAKLVATSLIMYSSDSDDMAPIFASSDDVTTKLTPYFQKPESTTEIPEVDLPMVSRSYTWNSEISGKSFTAFDMKSWMFFDPKEYGKKFITAKLDSSVRALDELELNEVKGIKAVYDGTSK